MANLIIFDLDGVLIDSKDIHFLALNKALEEINPIYVINKEDHLSAIIQFNKDITITILVNDVIPSNIEGKTVNADINNNICNDKE